MKKASCSRPLFDWQIPFYENRKVTKTCPKIDPAAVELIKEHNRLDLELYRFGNQLFQTSLEEKKHAVEEGLARYASPEAQSDRELV